MALFEGILLVVWPFLALAARTAPVVLKFRLNRSSRAVLEKIEVVMSERRHGEQTDDESANIRTDRKFDQEFLNWPDFPRFRREVSGPAQERQSPGSILGYTHYDTIVPGPLQSPSPSSRS
ncbi:hypothetical protein B0H19DRAFT_329431 [Mycena capillaripes]|nr:hypothetical protein B0H19DRAFT_329431 [Mycena capillaripes]